MARFSGALGLLLITSVGVDGAKSFKGSIPPGLRRVAKEQSARNPKLRAKEIELKRKLRAKLQDMDADARKLNYQNYNNANYNNYGQQQQQNNYQYNQANQYQQGGNGYNMYDNYNYQWNSAMAEQDLGFDITNYAIKYTQCATVQTYSDELANDPEVDTVLAAKRFALFRLCPADQCSDYSNNGCGSNYGEYLVSLDQFLMSMVEYQREHVAGYCQYCQECATIESAKMFYMTAKKAKEITLETAQENYENWYEQYIENMQAQQNYNQGQYQNSNQYQNANGEDYESDEAAMRYFYQLRNNNNNYANSYAKSYYGSNYNKNSYSNNYGNSYSNNNGNSYNSMNANSNTYSWTNQRAWEFQRSQQQNQQNYDSWQNMGGNGFGTYFGKKVLNGYFNEDGEFVQEWGYFNWEGNYVSLEDEEIDWDEELWGEKPEAWDNIDENTESCDYQYAGSCYNQYDSCMQILGDENYAEYSGYQNAQNQGGVDQYGYYQQPQEEQERPSLMDFLQCTEIDAGNANYGGNVWKQSYQNANQNYQQNMEMYNSYYSNQYAQKYTYNYGNRKLYQNGNYNKYANYQNKYCDGDDEEECWNQYRQQQYQYSQNAYNYEMEQADLRRYFIGPHCGSDGRKISLAVYSDPYCSVADTNTTVEKLINFDPMPDSSELIPDECLACGIQDGAYEPWYEGDEQTAEDGLEPMCSMLYQFAGKCNRNLKATEFTSYSNNYQNSNYQDYYQDAYYQDANAYQYQGANQGNNGGRKLNYYNDDAWKQMYQSENQQQNEEAVCAFIESLSSGTYDEDGTITLSNGKWASPSAWSKEFKAESKAMGAGHKAALVLMAMLTATMAICACILHGQLARKNIPWRPRRAKGQDPTDLARQNSGITMGRSRSGQANAPLI